MIKKFTRLYKYTMKLQASLLVMNDRLGELLVNNDVFISKY